MKDFCKSYVEKRGFVKLEGRSPWGDGIIQWKFFNTFDKSEMNRKCFTITSRHEVIRLYYLTLQTVIYDNETTCTIFIGVQQFFQVIIIWKFTKYFCDCINIQKMIINMLSVGIEYVGFFRRVFEKLFMIIWEAKVVFLQPFADFKIL